MKHGLTVRELKLFLEEAPDECLVGALEEVVLTGNTVTPRQPIYLVIHTPPKPFVPPTAAYLRIN